MTIGKIIKNLETEYEVEIEWQIEDFSSRQKSNWIDKSPTFTWSDISWEIELKYYYGNEIQLFLCKPQSQKPLSVIFKFGITLMDKTTEMRCLFTKSFGESPMSWGTHELISESELLKRKQKLLPAGVLKLSCSLSLLDTLDKPTDEKYQSLDVLSSDLKALFDCERNTDINIVVGEQTFPVHKAILAARSDVFAAMFKHNMEEVNSGTIKIPDCDPSSFKDFLLFLYTGKIENFSSSNVHHIYKSADKYNVQELKVFCIKYIKRNLSAENVLDVIILANKFEETDLISSVQEIFNQHAVEIIKRDEWEQFVKDYFPIANKLLINKLENIKIDD